MKFLILLCIVGAAFAGQKECGDHEHYESCGTACPLTCDNYANPPKVCVLMCVFGCFCNEGYVRAADGRCVKPENCPSKAEDVCGENQRYLQCGSACPLTCDNYDNPPRICPAMCVSGCHCLDGYVKTSDGRCVRPEECPQRARPVHKTCLDKPDPGMCLAYIPSWYYDAKTGSCHKFVYGGCQGNGNRYASEEECMEHCKDVRLKAHSASSVCELPAEPGVCRGFFSRFYFDQASGRCQKFVYGGCGGNENNFKTLEECQQTCGGSAVPSHALDRSDCDKGPEPGLCDAYMPRFYYDQAEGMCKKFIYGGCGGNRNNFRTEAECYNKCGALLAYSACEEEKVVGPCRAAFPRYFYNKETKQCEKFIYGGCQGNSNNFFSKDECEAVCVA